MVQRHEDTFPYPKRKEKEKLPEIKKKKKEKKYNGHTVYFVIIVFRNNIIVTPCKGIRILESGKFRLVESGILENFVKESGIPGRQIRNPKLSWIPLHDAIIANKEDLV